MTRKQVSCGTSSASNSNVRRVLDRDGTPQDDLALAEATQARASVRMGFDAAVISPTRSTRRCTSW